MLNITGKNLTDSQNLFLNSSTVTMLPVVSAEWNQNLFNQPYLTVAGTGVKETVAIPVGLNEVVDASVKNPNFTTYAMHTTNGSGSQSFTVTTASPYSAAYKIVTYVLTDQYNPAMLTSYAQGSSTQYGSTSVDVNSFGWTKVTTYIGSSGNSDPISIFTYTLSLNTYSSDSANPTVYYTKPEVYATTYFDYQYHSLWSTDAIFSYFRPGESYVESGNSKYSLPSNFRNVKTRVLNSQAVDGSGNLVSPPKFPISPIIQNPNFCAVSTPAPFYKNVMPSDMSAYKYFVSDSASKSVSALYQQNISFNKIVIKVNNILATPTFNISINGGSPISVKTGNASSTSITPNEAGLIILYATKQPDGSISLSTDKWASMPKFNYDGTVSNYSYLKEITLTQTSYQVNTKFSDYPARSQNVSDDIGRMQIIEISPRLEIDLSDYVMGVDINKSLDSKNTVVPISSINTDDASILLSAIPILSGNNIIPIFSSQSNLSINVLSNMLRKNIKFYVSFNVKSNFNTTFSSVDAYVPGGIYYSDTWNETDVKTVKVQCYDVTRYLQTTPVPDYVANLKSVFEVVTNILDLAGYTDYDYDSLYSVCNNASSPMDMAYYYCNSKDTTIVDALSQIFLANQIGAYIDEYNVMRFLSLSQILNSKTSSITIDDSNVITGGYSITNKAKPGKISVRYQLPKVKQSLALQNATAFAPQTAGSFIYTTSNDVVWTQQNSDSVGFNHLSESLPKQNNKFKLNVNDLLNIFHTYSLNNNGYASIENEIVSFLYKEYTIVDGHGNPPKNVSVKNDLELQAEINKYVKQYESGLALSMIDDTGNPIKPVNANVTVTPTGYITNVQRGLFGTPVSDHNIITGLTQKGLKEATINSSFSFSDVSDGTNTKIVNNKLNDVNSNTNIPSVEKIQIKPPVSTKSIIYPNETDKGYKTYSAKFDMYDNPVGSAGIFFNATSGSSTEGSYFVELIKIAQSNVKTPYKYVVAISQVVSGASNVIAFSEITSIAYSIMANFEKIMFQVPKTSPNDVQHNIASISNSNSYQFVMDSVAGLVPGMYVQGNGVDPLNTKISSISGKTITLSKATTSNQGDMLTFSPYSYSATSDQTFNLKVNHYYNDSSLSNNGDSTGELIEVFLNNVEINGWQVPSSNPTPHELFYGWETTGKNTVTGLNKRILISNSQLSTVGKNFGFFMSTAPTQISTAVTAYVGSSLETTYQPLFTYPASTNIIVGNLREIYACEKLLNERSVNYWFQDREFLNGLIQGQNIFSKYKSYMMQTNPEVLGINYYDVQYTTPAAVSVDVLPVEYLWYYFPGNEPQDQKFYQTQLVDEYSLAYSTPLNTGFRARMAIANNASHMVYLKKDSDSLNQFTINLNLWTHEIVAQSDPEIIEKVLDQSNITEVVQLDSPWIQSKDTANRLLSVVEKGIDGFSRDTTIQIFGNPLIQVGDIISLSYNLAGLNSQKYLVHSVTHNFSQGLKTTLVLNMLDRGVFY